MIRLKGNKNIVERLKREWEKREQKGLSGDSIELTSSQIDQFCLEILKWNKPFTSKELRDLPRLHFRGVTIKEI